MITPEKPIFDLEKTQLELEPLVPTEIRACTCTEELERILAYLTNLEMYQQKGYKLVFPETLPFQAALADPSSITSAQEAELKRHFENEVYDKNSYANGLDKLNHEENNFQKAIQIFQRFTVWGFYLPPSYLVRLTLYGTGGSYQDRTAIPEVIIRTTTQGEFLRKMPLHTLIHETFHIGTEKVIVEKFALNHNEKERLADLACLLCFPNLIQNYVEQPRGDKNLDEFIKSEADFAHLPDKIQAYVNKYPRDHAPERFEAKYISK